MTLKFHRTAFYLCTVILFQSCAWWPQNPKVSEAPLSPKIYTDDIDNFYKAFDLAIEDTSQAEEIFRKEYFAKGTKGLRDFYRTKIGDVGKFSSFAIRHQQFYASIRNDISNVDDLKEVIYGNFKSFKSLYPEAVFPDIYMLVGRFNSNGTISKRGLLIGTEVLSRTGNTDTEGWNKNILRISMLRNHIPVTISHELVHFNQSKMDDKNNTLLAKCLREGSAEFIAELICGETDGDYSEFVGQEREIWDDFMKEKNQSAWNTWSEWQRTSEKNPKNAGYWAGYMVCKAYFSQTKNQDKAVSDILSIQNYQDFYQQSKVDEYMSKQYGR